ncbi:MAG: 2-amino-4-hydroxy-6-hydroxymethyldihydropteridine diphosphokinase [Ignavibacteriaceae bacterium]
MDESKKHSSYIGLGSNLDDRFSYLKKAVELIEQSSLCRIIKISSVYETKPFGIKDQGNFLNGVIAIETELALHPLLDFLKGIEQQLGRRKREKWECREIDLDILFFDDLVYSDERVTVPHPYIPVRDFVLVPLCEIAPGFFHPGLQKSICDIVLKENEQYVINVFSSPNSLKESYGVAK